MGARSCGASQAASGLLHKYRLLSCCSTHNSVILTRNHLIRGRTYDHPLKRKDHGVVSAMQVHEFTLYDMLVRNAFIYGDRPAVIHTQGRLTFRDFIGRVDALAAGLAALPLHKGERVCILALNHPSYLELYGACARLGVIAYPLNWRLTSDELSRIVERATPRMLLVDDTTLPLVADCMQTCYNTPYWYTIGTAEAPRLLPYEPFYHATCALESTPVAT